MPETLAVPEASLLIGGDWTRSQAREFVPVHNPATGEVLSRTPLCPAEEADAAVRAAQEAYPAWSGLPAPKRAAILFQCRAVLEAHFEELARLVTRENGKTLEEARGDVRRGLEVVEFACGAAQLTKGEALSQVADQIDGITLREPLGVCAGITPFNFPAMVPLWMFPLAVACGNTFVLKPSEKTPLTAIRLAELCLEAGLPKGVLNIVHGGRAAVDALAGHPLVAAVSFVGSSSVARHVYTLASSHGKRAQAAGGAKNVLLVMPDADPDSTLRAILGSAFGCAGQRCMAGSLLLAVGEAAEPLRRRLLEALAKLRVGDPSTDPKAEMGPVIDAAARDRVLDYIDRGLRQGAQLALDGRRGVPKAGFFVGPTLFDHASPGMDIARDEIFGPLLTLLRVQSLEEALAVAKGIPYGNGASIFTGSGLAARRFCREIPCGMLGVNVGVPAPMAFFSFSGWNQSFYGDLHVQGKEGVLFYTRQKAILSRWDGDYRRQHGW